MNEQYTDSIRIEWAQASRLIKPNELELVTLNISYYYLVRNQKIINKKLPPENI